MYRPESSESPLPLENHEEFLDGDHLKDEAEFMLHVGKFIEMLESQQTPSREMHEFEFLRQDNGVYAYPEILSDRLMTRTLESVNVTLTKELYQPSTTTIEFVDADGRVYVSRDPEQHNITTSDVVIDNKEGTQSDVGRIPDHEVDAFLYSLVGMYRESEFARETKTDARVNAENILSSLESNAITTRSSFEFELASGSVARYDTIRSSTRESLRTFSISYEIAQDKMLVAQISRQQGLEITFRRYDGDATTPIFPDGGDYIRLIEIINQEIATLSMPQAPIGDSSPRLTMDDEKRIN